MTKILKESRLGSTFYYKESDYYANFDAQMGIDLGIIRGFHRTDGAAIISDESKSYFLNKNELYKESYLLIVL